MFWVFDRPSLSKRPLRRREIRNQCDRESQPPGTGYHWSRFTGVPSGGHSNNRNREGTIRIFAKIATGPRAPRHQEMKTKQPPPPPLRCRMAGMANRVLGVTDPDGWSYMATLRLPFSRPAPRSTRGLCCLSLSFVRCRRCRLSCSPPPHTTTHTRTPPPYVYTARTHTHTVGHFVRYSCSLVVYLYAEISRAHRSSIAVHHRDR